MRTRRALLCITLSCFLFSPAFGASRIENGNEVPASSPLARSAALLVFNGGGFCSASFLSARTLLSAGHCLKGVSASGVKVQLPTASGWLVLKVSAVSVHPGYRLRYDNKGQAILRDDIALVQLEKAAPVSVRALSLSPPPSGNELFGVTDLGYGFEYNGGGGMLLRYGRMQGKVQPIYDLENQPGVYQTKTKDDENVCPGDSGGPVLLGAPESRSVIAVHSLADGCQSESDSAESTLVWPYREWIRPQIRQ